MGAYSGIISISYLTFYTYLENCSRIAHVELPYFFLFFFVIFIEVKLIYNVVLASDIQQSESVVHMHIPTYIWTLPIQAVTEYQVEFPVLYSRSLLVIYFIYSSVRPLKGCNNMAALLGCSCAWTTSPYLYIFIYSMSVPVSLFWGFSDKDSTCQCWSCSRLRFNPWVGKITWRRQWQHTPGFLSGKIAWTEEPGGLQRVRYDWVSQHTHVQSSNLSFPTAYGYHLVTINSFSTSVHILFNSCGMFVPCFKGTI